MCSNHSLSFPTVCALSHHIFYYSQPLARIDYRTSQLKTLPASLFKYGSWASPVSPFCTAQYLTREYGNFHHCSKYTHVPRLAALVMRILATGWAVYTTWRGPAFAAIFQELIAGPTSPCFLDLFSTYWKIREVYEVRTHPHIYRHHPHPSADRENRLPISY